MPISENSNSNNVPAISGKNTAGGDGVTGVGRRGVVGTSDEFQGVYGKSRDNAGVVGESAKMHAVFGITHSTFAGVAGFSDAGGAGLFGESNDGVGVHAKGGRLAGLFDGNVNVNGKLFVTVDIELANGDCAEEFWVAEPKMAEPGTVMVLGEEETLHCCCQEYDKRVAGVVSGAGSYRPAIVLDRRNDNSERRPLAIMGKVYCKVDADYAPIEVGDLLTTSPSPGHAMKATDGDRAFGAVIGKALRRHQRGKGLIPILIALQ